MTSGPYLWCIPIQFNYFYHKPDQLLRQNKLIYSAIFSVYSLTQRSLNITPLTRLAHFNQALASPHGCHNRGRWNRDKTEWLHPIKLTWFLNVELSFKLSFAFSPKMQTHEQQHNAFKDKTAFSLCCSFIISPLCSSQSFWSSCTLLLANRTTPVWELNLIRN